jgi:type IV conjugative transfer system protein TraE
MEKVLAVMNLNNIQKTVAHVAKQRNFAWVVSAFLLASNVLLSAKIMMQDEQWILIPWPETDKRLPLSRSNFSEKYLIDWADALTSRLLTVNPQTADQRIYEFLSVAESRGSLEEKLKKKAQELKDENISTAFYPRDYAIRKEAQQIWVTGDFHTFFGRDKNPVVQKKTVVLTYRKGSKGVILVKDFYYEGEDEKK